MPDRTRTLKGAIAEAAVTLAATRLGIATMKPSIEGRRYDLILDVGPRLLRVQCKWGTRRGDAVVVRLGTSRLTPQGYVSTTYSAEEIDGFAVYCEHTGECYWLPIEEFGGRSYAHLRLAPARNGQRLLVKFAADHPFGAVAQLGERLAGSQKVRGSSPLSSIDEAA